MRTGAVTSGRPSATAPRTGARPVAEQVGHFFRDLRRNFRLSQPEAARRLATRIDIIAALEAGDVRGLPPWPETCRIVRSYTAPVGLDPRPILQLIELLQASAGRAAVGGRGQPRGDRDRRNAGGWLGEALRGPVARALGVLFAVSVPVALVVLVTQISGLEAAVAKLPPSVARIVRGAQNYVIVQLAPVRDGLRWIDVPDPRTRRGDKLPTKLQATAQSD